MEIITNAENRKELVKALSGHFGQRSEYLGPPSFAYRIGSITVDRDAKVILEDDSMEDEVRRVLFRNDVAEEIQETQTKEPDTNRQHDTTGHHQPDKYDAFQTVPYQQGSRQGVHFHSRQPYKCPDRKNFRRYGDGSRVHYGTGRMQRCHLCRRDH